MTFLRVEYFIVPTNIGAAVKLINHFPDKTIGYTPNDIKQIGISFKFDAVTAERDFDIIRKKIIKILNGQYFKILSTNDIRFFQ